MRSSFVHTGSTPVTGSNDRFLLDSARIYMNGTATANDQVHVQHRIRRRHQQNRRSGCSRHDMSRARIQYLDGPVYSTKRPRKPLRTLLRARVGSLYRWHPGWLSSLTAVHDRPRQWHCLLGRLRKSESLCRRVRWSHDNRHAQGSDGWPGTVRLLGHGKWLLPERNLLRREESARPWRGVSISVFATHAGTADFLIERKSRNGGVSTVESEYSYYDKLGG